MLRRTKPGQIFQHHGHAFFRFQLEESFATQPSGLQNVRASFGPRLHRLHTEQIPHPDCAGKVGSQRQTAQLEQAHCRQHQLFHTRNTVRGSQFHDGATEISRTRFQMTSAPGNSQLCPTRFIRVTQNAISIGELLHESV